MAAEKLPQRLAGRGRELLRGVAVERFPDDLPVTGRALERDGGLPRRVGPCGNSAGGRAGDPEQEAIAISIAAPAAMRSARLRSMQAQTTTFRYYETLTLATYSIPGTAPGMPATLRAADLRHRTDDEGSG